MTDLIVSGTVVAVVFVLALCLLLSLRKKLRADRARQAAEAAQAAADADMEQQRQLTERLMKTGLENRTALAFMACAMVNFGPVKLGAYAPPANFRLQLQQIAFRLLQSMDLKITDELEIHRELLNHLAISKEFMRFALTSLKQIDDFIGFYLHNRELWSPETRDAVRPNFLTTQDFLKKELGAIHCQFVGPIELA